MKEEKINTEINLIIRNKLQNSIYYIVRVNNRGGWEEL